MARNIFFKHNNTLRSLVRKRWRKWRACYGYENHDPVIQLNPPDIPNYFNLEDDVDPSTYSTGDQGSVWKKNILMGGKCQLPDFSGVIIYDSTGNVVTPAKQPAFPALTWK
ncbi:hypothetical protein ACJIZ3_019301 [Penstemon smallii]|uniref:Uncharacterized protein n=1 Tax=Penstemon smallii TaxID=265156 RepID=A0ABD3T0S6_9LAMI